jgi:predicted  nucleic acid-binding Zn-ribbon protein
MTTDNILAFEDLPMPDSQFHRELAEVKVAVGKVETKLDAIEKTLMMLARHSENMIIAQSRIVQLEDRVKVLESNQAKVTWVVVTAVMSAVLGLAFTKYGVPGV